MTITIDDKAVDIFKLYDELILAYSKDIESYRALVGAIEGMINRKERNLQEIRDKIIDLMKYSITTPGIALIQENIGTKNNDIEVQNMNLAVVQTVASSIKKKKSRTRKNKGTSRPKSLAVGKIATEPKTVPAKISKKTPPINRNELRCLYHPESQAVDIGRQLCSSCKWKLITNGLRKYDKEPSVISFLKGQSTTIPDLGQPMCPVHPKVPAYNQKTGLCKDCQKKAKTLGIQDRHPTKDELHILRNPFM